MKKSLSFFLCVILILCMPLTCLADSEYVIDDIGIKITFPDNYYVFTRDTLPDDEKFVSLGISYDGLMSVFAAENIYLEAMDTDAFNNFVIICSDTEEANYFDLGVDGLYKAVMSEEERLESGGREIIDADLFEAGNVDYVKIYSKAEDSRMQYITVYNGKKYEFRFVDYNESLTGIDDEYPDSLVEAAIFEQPAQKETAPSDSSADKEKLPQAPSASPKEADGTYPHADGSLADCLVDILIFVVLGIIICTIPVVIFRFIFMRTRLRKRTAFVFSFIYAVLMSVAFYFFILHLDIDTVSTYLCVLPLLWSFVIYKIVKS